MVDAASGIVSDQRKNVHRGEISSLKKLNKGEGCITGGADGRLLSWTIAGNRIKDCAQLAELKAPVHSLAVSPDDKYLLIGTEDATGKGSQLILSLDLERLEIDTIRTAHEFPIVQVEFLNEEGLFASASSSGKVYFGNLFKNQPERVPFDDAHTYSIQQVRAVRADQWMVSMDEAKICIWDTDQQSNIGCLEARYPSSFLLDADNRRLYYIDDKRFLFSLSLAHAQWIARAGYAIPQKGENPKE